MSTLPEIKINPVSEGEIELTGELGVSDFASYRDLALKTLGENFKLAGFRPGHIPEKILLDQLGEEKILWEMAQQALAVIYPQLLTENKIPALGRPSITITKIAKDNPLGFKIKTAIMPEIKIGDYKKIASQINMAQGDSLKEPKVSPLSVSDEEVDKTIEEIRKSRVTTNHSNHVHKEGEKCGNEEKLPELNDEFAQSLGQFKTLADLKAKIKENLVLEKKSKAKDKRRLEIIEEIIKQSEIKIAPLLLESEKDKMLAEMEMQISQMGLKFDAYLEHLKKTKEDLRNSWADQARQRVAFGLILAEVARLEKIEAPADELKTEMDYLKQQYKDVPEDRLSSYATSLIINEKVFEFLENIS